MLSTLFFMTQKVASKSKKRTALSFRKLFPDLFFIFSDILCDHRCRLFKGKRLGQMLIHSCRPAPCDIIIKSIG